MLLKELFDQKKSSTPRYDLVDDITFFIDNEDELHKEYFLPAVRELKRKKIVDRNSIAEIAPAFDKLVEKGCAMYNEKYKPEGKTEEIFSKQLMADIANKLAEKHLDYIKDGEYDPKEA
jgi:DNA-binding transcriptional regulator YhcF (GntR family)